MPTPKSAFPLWVILCGSALALAYLPTLSAPFDFLDDGNLVYTARDLSAAERVRVWWDKVRANVEHLGPFRPVVWAHWELAANTFGTSAVAWRAGRLAWCGLSASLLLWLMRELRVHPLAAVLAAAAAMWNPYRNDIWTSLTLAEGVAMPYALLALVAARKGAGGRWAWDAAAVGGLLLALGCKNTFVALIPPMILLRTWGAGRVRWKVLVAAVYAAPVLLAVGHFVYLKQNPGPCHYDTPGPSWQQAGQFLGWLKGAAGLDFLAAGLLAVLGVAGWKTWRHGTRDTGHGTGDRLPALAFAGTLLLSGFAVYLPVSIMCGRYTMPAVWGADVLLGLLLTRFLSVPWSWAKAAAWVLVGGGLAAVLVASVGRQEKLAARSRLLWQVLDHVERSAPAGAVVEWVSGPPEAGELNAEEGIHFYWHLLHRERADVRVRLTDTLGRPVTRVELPPPPGPPRFRVAASATDSPEWTTTADVRQPYHLGRKAFTVVVQEPTAPDPLPSGR